MLNAKRYAPMNARDKMPFEVTPIVYRLQRYEEAKTDAPATTAPAARQLEPISQPRKRLLRPCATLSFTAVRETQQKPLEFRAQIARTSRGFHLRAFTL